MSTPNSTGTAASTSEAPAPKKKRRIPVLSLAAWRQFVSVAKPYWLGEEKKKAWSLLFVLIVLMLAETQFAVMLNNPWRGAGARAHRRQVREGVP
jgi:putative ATP-binding cassette transporter